MKFAIFGCGFWSQFQLGVWLELDFVDIITDVDSHARFV